MSLGIRDKIAIGTFTLLILASLCAVWLRQETLLQELLGQQRLLEYRVGQLERRLDPD